MKFWQHKPKHVHEWSRWTDTEMAVTAAGLLSGARVGQTFIGQTRVCNSCGLRENSS